MSSTSSIRPDQMLPEILASRPHLRAVFDRYGLKGCGGHHGPPESLAHFARAHGVPLDRLIAELEQASAGGVPSSLPIVQPSRPADIHRPFFLAGILVMLTAGGLWGALILIQLAAARSFTTVPLHAVNAHGHAQIFGWVGLFVMGFALQAFPRFRHRELWRPPLARIAFGLMVCGIAARFVSEVSLAQGSFPWLGTTGGILEIADVSLFLVVLVRSMAGSDLPFEPYLLWIGSGMTWFLIQAVYDTVFFTATAVAPTRDALLSVVAGWQAPLRDIQIHGFAMLTVLGVSQRFLPGMLGLGPVPARRSRALWLPANLAVAGEAVFFILFHLTGAHAWMALSWLSAIALTGIVAALVLPFRLFRPAEPDRSIQFVRAAYVWRFLSLAMLIAAPLDFLAIGKPFSHAWWGASRHAITVGFLSLMIIGVSSKVVPLLAGRDPEAMGRLRLPFLLVNTGCAIRVGFQALTDFTPLAFPFAGVSGLLELTGIAVWAAGLAPVLIRGESADEPARVRPAGAPITADDRVAEILGSHPETEPVFLQFGLTGILNPLLRRTVARAVTLRQACAMHGVDVAALLAALESARTDGRSGLGDPAGAVV